MTEKQIELDQSIQARFGHLIPIHVYIVKEKLIFDAPSFKRYVVRQTCNGVIRIGVYTFMFNNNWRYNYILFEKLEQWETIKDEISQMFEEV